MTVIRNADGVPFSSWQPHEKFAYVYAQDGIGVPVEEFEFDRERRWRFDFAFPDQRIAVEIDGFGMGHQAINRLSDNHEKQNAAVAQGWRVLRFTSRQLGSKQGVADAVELVARVLCGAEN